MTTLANSSGHIVGERRRWRDAWARGLVSTPLRAIVGAVVVAAAIILLRSGGWLQPAELLTYDALRVAWAGRSHSDRIMLVGATEEDITADDGTRWPWPLPDDKLAAVLERLASWSPRSIAVDIYRDIPIYRDIQTGGENPLDAVLRRHPEILWVFRLKGDKKHPGTQAPKVLRGTERAVFADIPEDSDGIVRRALVYADDGSNQYTGLGAALALSYLAGERIVPQPGDGDELRLGKAVLRPLDETRGPYLKLDSRGYQVLYDYRGGPQPFRQASLSALMAGDDLAPLVRDRLVVLGVDADTVKDSFSTPFSTGFNAGGPVSGIAMHAHLADQLIRMALDGDAMLNALPRRAEGLWILGWALLGAMLSLLLRSTLPAVLGTGAGLVAIGVIVYAAFGRALWLPALPAALAWAGAAMLTNQLLHAASNRARAQLRQSFERYLPPAVIDRMVRANALPSLGGERREISVLFTDVAGFTTFSEARDPVELADITNQYLEGVCAAIFAHEGLVNAFMGDGVLAFFGAPQQQPDHADRAVAAALAIDRFAEAFRMEQQSRGVNFGHTRVGVHTGFAFVGNIGSRRRLQYTALGDMLNTGSRLEGLNKAIGSRVCVSRDVTAKCRQHRFRRVGDFIVKGRTAATEVYVPIDPERERPEWIARYEAAFRALEDQLPEAAERFAELHREDPADPCVAFHRARLAEGEVGTLIEMHEK
jgi:adenylate cyclase